MTVETPGLADIVAAPTDAAAFDAWDPANIAPLVAYLATEGCPATARCTSSWRADPPVPALDAHRHAREGRRWTVEELQAEMHKLGG